MMNPQVVIKRMDKESSSKQKNGFTAFLILAILTFVIVCVISAIRNDRPALRRRLSAQRHATALETAVNNFHTEYGKAPVTGGRDTLIRTDRDIDFLNTVLGLEIGPNRLNPRSVKFLDAREGRNGRNGLVFTKDGKSITGLLDPWGGPYYVLLDLDGDGKITHDFPPGRKFTLDRRVAVWSLGRDGKIGGGDDVATW
jgi:hypothetical protein